ncbi:MAG: hypothetical protein DRQ60_03175 [Gammaproteobacteria bacterium]|nr:MAG: hypothetical protein DRQ54_01275 [Gammaproteobacteria bacterium]RLA15945.1 MAG: hypothetical protein DRQ52_00555 [Gammaproteobacteria bacterium]RLA16978.1 MAG: hypothetical protein DRQ60_03175 [Gammaproteobacteria bacterium]
MKGLYVLGAALLLAACVPSGSNTFGHLQSVPQSWATLDVKELNEQVAAGVVAKEAWPRSPLQLVLHLFGGDVEVQSLSLKEMKNRSEGADATKIVWIRGGFLDDSVSGDWHEVDLRRLADGSWRINSARIAYRCRRATNPDEYQNKLCP